MHIQVEIPLKSILFLPNLSELVFYTAFRIYGSQYTKISIFRLWKLPFWKLQPWPKGHKIQGCGYSCNPYSSCLTASIALEVSFPSSKPKPSGKKSKKKRRWFVNVYHTASNSRESHFLIMMLDKVLTFLIICRNVDSNALVVGLASWGQRIKSTKHKAKPCPCERVPVTCVLRKCALSPSN